MEIFIRLIIIGVGIVFLLLASAGALLSLAKSYRQMRVQGIESIPSLEQITKLIDAVTALVKALISAPQWLGFAVVGFAMILLGAFIPLSF